MSATKVNASRSPALALRRMNSADIPAAHELRRLANWNQTRLDWAGYLAFEPQGCWVAEQGGEVVGTATTVTYGKRAGWIGMVLVHPGRRRGGIGTALLRAALDYLVQQGVGCIKLDATPMGRPVYLPLGFKDEYAVSRYEAVVPAGINFTPDAAPLTAADLSAVCAFDEPIFGAERSRILQALSRRNPQWCFVVRNQGNVAGYLIAREGEQAVQIGPWLARDATAGEVLLRALLSQLAGRRVFVDGPHPNAAVAGMMTKYGFTVQRSFLRMGRGDQEVAVGLPSAVFGTAGAEKG